MLFALRQLGNAIIHFDLDPEDVIEHSASHVVVKTNPSVLYITALNGSSIQVRYQVDGEKVVRTFASFDKLRWWLTTPPVVLTEEGFSNYFWGLLRSVDASNVYFKVANSSWVVNTATAYKCFIGNATVKKGNRGLQFVFNVFYLRFEADGKMPCIVRDINSGRTKQFYDESALKKWLTTPTTEQSKMLVLCKLDLPLDIKKKLKRYVGA